MKFGLKYSKSWVRGLAVLVILYSLLWYATNLVGVPKARTVALSQMTNIKSTWRDISADLAAQVKGPYYFCRATALAPFLIRVEYGWEAGKLDGDGGSVLYLWIFGAVFRAHEYNHWAA